MLETLPGIELVHTYMHNVMRSEKPYMNLENMFLRRSNVKLLGLKISIFSFEQKYVVIVMKKAPMCQIMRFSLYHMNRPIKGRHID